MPRKTLILLAALLVCAWASMRPRPDAAENHFLQRLAPDGRPMASMRPRPDAAENPSLLMLTLK